MGVMTRTRSEGHHHLNNSKQKCQKKQILLVIDLQLELICQRRGAVVKGVEHISTIVLVNI